MQPLTGSPKVAIELHDSEVTGVRPVGEGIAIDLSAYVHRTEGEPGVDLGTVWKQPACITLRIGRHFDILPATLDPIYDGIIVAGTRTFSNMVPCPFVSEGDAAIDFTLSSGDRIRFDGNGLTLTFTGEAEYLYDFDY